MDEVVVTDSDIIALVAPEPDIEIEVLDGTDQEIVFVGDAGIQGPPGAGVAPGGDAGDVLVKQSGDDYDTGWTPLGTLGGDKTFTQDFAPATFVTVNHNLGKFPAVTIITTAGDEVEAEVDHLTTNQLTISFSAANGGKVICN